MFVLYNSYQVDDEFVAALRAFVKEPDKDYMHKVPAEEEKENDGVSEKACSNCSKKAEHVKQWRYSASGAGLCSSLQ